MRKWLIGSVIVAALGFASWYANHREWGPGLLGDTLYVSGRKSLCKASAFSGDSLASTATDLGRRPRLEGFEHDWDYRIASGGLSGGVIALCSEYGWIHVRGVDSGEARLRVTISDPFPGGDGGIDDTHINFVARRDSGGLRLGVWQATQGMTTFRSMMAKGARPAAVNLTLELPRRGVYRLDLVANHQRLTVENLNVEGKLAGYLSPGAKLDVGLGGPLALRLNNAGLKPDYRREAGIDFEGGTTATLRALVSATVDAEFSDGDAVFNFPGSDVGLDVTAKDSSGVRAQRAGPVSATRMVVVRATAGGTLTVNRTP